MNEYQNVKRNLNMFVIFIYAVAKPIPLQI